MVKLYYIPITASIEENVYRKLLTHVSNEKQESVNRFHADIDKKLSLYSELFVRVMACRKLGIQNDEIEFGKGKYGKPFVNGYPAFHYNISHTRNAVAAAFSDKEIGIDIEKIGNNDCGIARRFFTIEEYEYIYQRTGPEGQEREQNRRFFEIWTKKEAYIKCIGKGLSQPLDSFNVLDLKSEFKCHGMEKDNYMISVCGSGLEKTDRITEISERDLENQVLSQESVLL